MRHGQFLAFDVLWPHMTFQELIDRARTVREKYRKHEEASYGRQWTAEDLVQGLVVDVGELTRLVMAKKGIREIDGVDEKLQHELADCLWSVIVLSDSYGIDLEQAFVKTMNELDERLQQHV